MKEKKPPSESGTYRKGRHLATLEQSEREERHDARRTLRSAYLTIIGETPQITSGDHSVAVTMLAKVNKAWGKRALYTPAERARLGILRGIWERRVRGEDAQYNLCGTRAGRPKKPENEEPWINEYRAVKDLKRWITEHARPAHPKQQKKRVREIDLFEDE